MASFEIVFVPNEQISKMKIPIVYKINKIHKFKILVTGEIKPCELKVDKSILSFKFNENSYDITSTEILKLKNQGNSDVNYNFILTDNPVFDVKPRRGIVKSNTFSSVQVI